MLTRVLRSPSSLGPAAGVLAGDVPSSRSVLADAFWSALFRCAIAGGGLGLAVVLVRTLGPERSGVFYLAFSFVTIGSTLGQAGMNNLLARRMARAEALGGAGSSAVTFASARRTALAASAGIAAAVVLGAPWLAVGLCGEPALVSPLRILALAIPSLSVALVSGEALKGMGRPLLSQLFQVGAVPIVALALVPVAVPRFGIAGAAGAFALAAFLAASTSLYVVRKLLPGGRSASAHHAASDPGAARSMLLLAVTGVLAVRLGPILVGALDSSRAVVELEVGLRLVMIANLVLVGVNSAMAPRFAALHAQGRRSELERAARVTARLSCALVLPYLLAVCVLHGTLLTILGLDFPSAGALFLALAFGEAVNALTGPATLVLLMGGGERRVRDTAVAATLLNGALCYALVPLCGALGAALGAAGGTALLNLGSVFWCKRLFDVCTLPFGWRRRRA